MPLSSNKLVILTAIHQGPYLTVNALEKYIPDHNILYIVEGIAKDIRIKNKLPYVDVDFIRSNWGSLDQFFLHVNPTAIIRSASENVLANNIEAYCSVSASNTGVPLFIVDDFPGNYWPNKNERLDKIFIEHESLVSLYETRGISPNKIRSLGNPRYQSLGDIDIISKRQQIRRILNLTDESAWLWAGAPDAENSFLSLQRLISKYNDPNAVLLLKAHPRDSLYNDGRYTDIIKQGRIRVMDVSHNYDMLDLYCASDLVVSQYSSANVEAAHMGIPSVFVLFENLGQKYLSKFKGYSHPTWCYDNCSFVINEDKDIHKIMNIALYDQSERNTVTNNFSKMYGLDGRTARNIVEDMNLKTYTQDHT